jgi:hypothetical protein
MDRFKLQNLHCGHGHSITILKKICCICKMNLTSVRGARLKSPLKESNLLIFFGSFTSFAIQIYHHHNLYEVLLIRKSMN